MHPMKFMTFLQLLLTVFTIVVIFKIATDKDVTDKLQTKIADQQMMAATGVSASEAIGLNADSASAPYSASVAGETDLQALEARAKTEADKMVKNGDISAYRKEVENNPLLKKIISGNQ